MSLLDVNDDRSPSLMEFPVETLLEVPGTGRIRAVTLFNIEGAEELGAALEETIQRRAPFWVHIHGTSPPRSLTGASHNLGSHSSEVDRYLARVGAGIHVIPAPGEWLSQSQTRSFEPDAARIRVRLRNPNLALPSPNSPGESADSLDRSSITVEVLNAGASAGAAARMSDVLRAQGFSISRVGDFPGERVEGIVVYYRTSRLHGDAVAAVISSNVTARRLPSTVTTTALVLVLVGSTG